MKFHSSNWWNWSSGAYLITREYAKILIDELKIVLAKSNTSKSEIVSWLNKCIPEFEHIETGLSLDNKM